MEEECRGLSFCVGGVDNGCPVVGLSRKGDEGVLISIEDKLGLLVKKLSRVGKEFECMKTESRIQRAQCSISVFWLKPQVWDVVRIHLEERGGGSRR